MVENKQEGGTVDLEKQTKGRDDGKDVDSTFQQQKPK